MTEPTATGAGTPPKSPARTTTATEDGRRIQVFAEDGGTFGWRLLEDDEVVFDGGGYEDKAHAEDFARDHYGFELPVEDLAADVGRRAVYRDEP